MKAAIGCLIGLVFVVGASAEPLLEGQVRLPSGEPVAYAQVQVFDLTDLQRGAVAQATTNGTGYFALSLAALPGLALPERFELGANYPNPFNPATIIPYQLAASSPVRLEVFNLLGQRIATLVEGEQPAGSHTATWQATDAAGRAVGAGVYLYRLTVGEAHQTGRMVLVDGQAGVPAVGGDSVWPIAAAQDREYGLVVSGQGIAPYVVPDFRIQAGMAPVDLVVEAHPAGQVLGDDCAFCDLFDVLNDDDEGPGPSGKAVATLAAPAAPTNLRFEAVTDSSCTVRWDAAEGATDYDVNYKPAVGGKWTNEPHRGTGLYNTINDLKPGTEYRWAVRAENGDGSSAWVFGPNFTTLADETDETTEEEAADGQAPAAPTNLRFEAVTDSSCTVRWDAAEGATDYDVNYKPAVGGQWISEPHRGTGLYNTINDLEPGTEYRWAVRAENGDDRSAWVFGPNFTTLPDNQDRLTAGTAMDDRAVLVSLYNTTDGSNWSTSTTWLSDKPIGEWYGVTTDGDGRVVELRLRDNQLSGPIPPELGSLANLRSLDLKDNRLTGEIPARLGNLTNLEMLNLSWNRLFGEIPPELGSLAKLQKLYLGANRIRGGIPPDLGNLTHLRELWLGDGLDLTGEIPLELSRLTQLEVLDLGHSEINGAIPRWLGSMSGLRQLYLDGNEFAGEVPAELGNLTRLELLTLDDNPGLWGVLPEALTAITGLRRLTFHDTGLCAPLDESFQAWLRKVSDRQGLNCLFGSRDRVIIRDMFGRVVNETGIVVVDWEGHIANPAMKYSVELPGPTAILSSTEPRLYFDLPSLAGANGPTKTLASQGLSQATEFRISIFPDRDTSDERHSLTIRYMADQGQIRSQAIDIHVIDQDIDDIDRPPEFNIITDFRYDRRRTRMFDDLVAKATVQQGLDDWAYFIADMNLDEVRAGEEQMWIWDPGGYESGRTVTNAINYTGYLMHVYGHVTGVATGGPTCGSNQLSGGVELPIPRSGAIVFNPHSTRGWVSSTDDDEWWRAQNLRSAPRDLYAGTLHEAGHALVFMGSNCLDGFARFYEAREVRDTAVKAYYGSYPRMDRYGHLAEGTIDPASRRGAFGREFQSETPRGRPLVTKLDLLIAQATGYVLRDRSPFIPLSITDQLLPEGTLGTPYSYTATVSGGTPAYYWAIESGTLPAGLSIDSFTGTISGTPSQQGTFNFTISVSDYDETTPSITRAVTLSIRE